MNKWEAFSKIMISQENTGYCWLASALNCLEHKSLISGNFSLRSYIFQDKMLKAQAYLKQIYNQRANSAKPNKAARLGSNPTTDHGTWAMAAALVSEQGVLLDYDKPQSQLSTEQLNNELSFLLNYCAYELIETNCDKPIAYYLNLVQQVLEKHLGECSHSSVANSFPFEDYSLISRMGYLQFNDLVKAQLDQDDYVWISCDANLFYNPQTHFFDDKTICNSRNLPLSFTKLSHSDICSYKMATQRHAMTLVGYELTPSGIILSAYNSKHPPDESGYCSMSASWFTKYSFSAAIKKELIENVSCQ